MFTYITTTTVPSFPELQEQYNLTVDLVNWTVAIPALGLALGPLVWTSIADIYGRRIIFLLGTIIALVASIGAAKAPSYGGYMAARFFQGFGVSPAATVGLAIINDIFFEHERGQKIGFWVLAIDMGIYVGPLIGGFMDLVNHFWIQWLTAIIFGTILVAEIFFLPETLYPRNHMLARMPYTEGISPPAGETAAVAVEKISRRPSLASEVPLKRTHALPYVNAKPVPGLRHPKPWDSLFRFGKLFKYPVVSLTVFAFCYGWYWWILSLITLLPVAYAQYSPQIQGLFFLGFILGTLLAEMFCSGRLSDWMVIRLAKRNGGVVVAEMRLWLVYPGAFLSASKFPCVLEEKQENSLDLLTCFLFIVGLIIWGVSIDKNYHWIVGQIAFFLCMYFQTHPSSPFPNPPCSRRRCPNRQHSRCDLHRQQLSPAKHIHYCLLFCAPQPQCFHRAFLR
jgi:MFS family permease